MSTEAQRNAANGSGNMFTMSADLSEIAPVAPIARNGYAPFAGSPPGTLVSTDPIVAPNLEQSPSRCVVIGDSHNALLGPTATSGQRAPQISSWIHWAMRKTEYSIPILANLAVGGTRVDQIAATVDAALALNPDIVLESSVTNDILQNYRWSAQRAIKQAYCERIIATGAQLVLFIAPAADPSTEGIQDTLQHRQWCYGFAAQNRNVTIVDALAMTVDPASATLSPLSGMLRDGVHMSFAACKLVGEAAALLRPFSTPKSREIPPATTIETALSDPDSAQLYENPGLSGSVALSGTGVLGVGPTAWNVSRGGTAAGTCVGSLVLADGWTDFVCTYADCADGTIFQRQLNPPAPLLARLVGKTVIFEWEVEYDGMIGVCEDFLEVYTPAGNNYSGTALAAGRDGSSGLIPQADGSHLMRSKPVLIPASTTVLRFNWKTVWMAAGGGVQKIRKVRILDAAKLAAVGVV